jgi:hypothetical protein
VGTGNTRWEELEQKVAKEAKEEGTTKYTNHTKEKKGI